MPRSPLPAISRQWLPWLALLAVALTATPTATASTVQHRRTASAQSSGFASASPGSAGSSSAAGLTFDGTFASVTPWTSGGGGVQCANYGTPSKSPRLRGNFTVDTSNVGYGFASGVFTLPPDTNKSTFPLEACDLETRLLPIGLGTDSYYGLMVYVPAGWTIPNNTFTGVNIEEFHFQNIWGAPVIWQLHPDHVTLSLETGGCATYRSSLPGCQFRSNADNPSCRSTSTHTCLPGYYAIPPGAFVEGAWNELMMHVHWASDSTGAIQVWYKQKGQPTWNQSVDLTGIPTVQWNQSMGCCYASYRDEVEAYTAGVSAPMSVWFDQDIAASSQFAIMANMP